MARETTRSENYGARKTCTLIGCHSNPNQGSAKRSLLKRLEKLSASRAELKTNSEAVGGDEEEVEDNEDLHLDGFHEGVLAEISQGEALEIRLNRQCCEYAHRNTSEKRVRTI